MKKAHNREHMIYQNNKEHMINECKKFLFEQVMSFWIEKGIDKINGGIYTGMDREGTIIETDKSVWFQGRALWIFSTMYNTVVQDEKLLEFAELCIYFINNFCFDQDGKMFFRVTNDGNPVIKRERYIFSETFTIIGFASYAKAINDYRYIEKARVLLKNIYRMVDSNILISKTNQDTRFMQGVGYHMMMLNTLQELRKYDVKNSIEYTCMIMKHIDEIQYFVKDDMRCVLETVGKKGTFLSNHIEGRLINPGHDIELGWFILQEAIYQKSEPLQVFGLNIINYAWEWGWDEEYGGMFYFRDALHYPVSEYWHDMKFWWPQNEAVIANLMAYTITKDNKYFERYEKVWNWAHAHFVDKEYGEWFGYLHRDGSISSELKGNMYKGPFHIPRMYLCCIEILENM